VNAVLSALTATDIARLVQGANTRIVYAAPGLTQEIAASLVTAGRRLPRTVVVILDVGAHSARLGYGDFDAVTLLHENGIVVRQQDGLRIGFLAVDDVGYAFNLPPLLVENVAEMGRACNAIALDPAQLEQMVRAIAPGAAKDAESPATATEPVIGKTQLSATTVEKVRAELAVNPPQKFDLARKVNVFNAHVEFVEMSLSGTHVGRHTAQLPRDLLLATRDTETQKRVQATFKIVGENSALAKEAQAIARKVTALRALYLRTIGSLGSLMLRSKRDEFTTKVDKLGQEIDAFRASAEERLQSEIDKSRRKLVEALLPAIKRNPPEDLWAQVSGKPTNEIVERYLSDRLKALFPAANQLIQDMRLDVAYKGVTYEMLRDKNFQEAVRKAFPYERFELFDEFKASPVVQPRLMRAAD
jgi:hypothetical protein